MALLTTFGRKFPVLYGLHNLRTIPSFRVFRDEGKIQFSTMTEGTVIMEYVSSGVSSTGDTYVPSFVAEALIEYLHWRDRKNNKRYSRGEVIDAKQDYMEAERILMDIETLPSVKELMHALSSNYRQTPKR